MLLDTVRPGGLNGGPGAALAPPEEFCFMTSVNDVRSAFLDYFAKAGHEVVASGPLVPRNDPTLMFTNAGMVQFKDYFTGKSKAPCPRAVTAQKCVRAGGKHNDLDNVGYTARHHTFFEMLGNFSFGDYFKERAIELAWSLVTREFGLPAERLLVTVYAEDYEAFGLWRKIAGLPEEKVVRIPTHDNFWAMGDTGPCGPCSEIFYDHGEHIIGGPPGSPEEDGDRFIEIWNLVFMQFEQVTKDERVDLPKPAVDTGMGLERMAAVLQGTHDNYETDLFKALIGAVEEATGVATADVEGASHRVIADHLRATSFLIADGVLPSNEGRGYVLRRIMRRAMRHANLLGASEPVIFKLVPALVHEMGQAYPELGRAEALVTETLKLEETRFQKTLSRGLALLGEASSSLGEGDILDGETAFKLYDTYGFPLDLTQDALKPRGVGVDLTGFNDAMERQREEARAHWAGSGEAATDEVWHALRESAGASEFLGYATDAAEAVVAALVADGDQVERLETGAEGAIIVSQTPFYGEAGGQVGDTGAIETEAGDRFCVTDTQRKADGLIVHYGTVEAGSFSSGVPVRLAIDAGRRASIRANHSATHLIHAALRRTLGDHVVQKGSLVAPDRLRFDFAHPKPMAEDEMAAVEDLANAIVLQDAPVETHLMDRDSAIDAGAMALFGEKYGDEVRVVSMGRAGGEAADGDDRKKSYSLELCGGTHVGRTGEIGLVTLVSESAVAAGVRRLEALSAEGARRYLGEQDRRLRDVAARLKVPPEKAALRVEALIEERRKLERELAETRKKLALGAPGEGAPAMRKVGSVTLMARAVEGIAPKDLRGLVDQGKQQVGSGVVAIVGVNDGKAGLIVGVTDDLTDRISAVDLVRLGSAALGGSGGGGRPDLAQAGGPDVSKADEALDAIAGKIGELAA
jgi:alanyl-tRNA synthetase